MYLHLGKGYTVKSSDIIAIFDLDIVSQAHITRAYLKQCEERGEVINAAEDIPKSFIVCQRGKERKLYLSQLSVMTLKARSEQELRMQ